MAPNQHGTSMDEDVSLVKRSKKEDFVVTVSYRCTQ